MTDHSPAPSLPPSRIVLLCEEGKVLYTFRLEEHDGQPATPAGAPPRPAMVPPDALWLSPLEERLVAVLAANGRYWMTGADLARVAGVQYGNRVKGKLLSLVARKIIEAAHGAGYRARRAGQDVPD